jgi:hypothetical protein
MHFFKRHIKTIRCQTIRSAANLMELDLRLDTEADRRFVTDKFAKWGYKVIAVRDADVAIPQGITVLVESSDDQGIIDKMCHEPEFDVKC